MDWRVFFLTFATLFVAELGDKTQLATIAMVTEHKTPVAVFLGASLALAAVTLLGRGLWAGHHPGDPAAPAASGLGRHVYCHRRLGAV